MDINGSQLIYFAKKVSDEFVLVVEEIKSHERPYVTTVLANACHI